MSAHSDSPMIARRLAYQSQQTTCVQIAALRLLHRQSNYPSLGLRNQYIKCKINIALSNRCTISLFATFQSSH